MADKHSKKKHKDRQNKEGHDKRHNKEKKKNYVQQHFQLSSGLSIPYYLRSETSLNSLNPNIFVVIAVIHGHSRNADEYIRFMHKSARKSLTDVSNVFVFAPNFCTKKDPDVGNGIIYWDKNLAWKEGLDSTVNYPHRISSYRVIDEMLGYILQSKIFPNLKKIIVAGHSAGGQFVQRYAMTTPFVGYANSCGISVRFFAANASSYVYLSPYRQKRKPSYDSTNYNNLSEIYSKDRIEWIIPNDPQSANYNKWKYGLDGDLPNYAKNVPKEQLISQFLSRDVTYLAGTADILNSVFDPNCKDSQLDTEHEAMLQGNCRLERAVNFYNHVMHFTGGNSTHKLVFVQGFGHDADGMFNSPEGRAAIFGNIFY